MILNTEQPNPQKEKVLDVADLRYGYSIQYQNLEWALIRDKLESKAATTWDIIHEVYGVEWQPLLSMLLLEFALEKTIRVAQTYGITLIKTYRKGFYRTEVTFNSMELAEQYAAYAYYPRYIKVEVVNNVLTTCASNENSFIHSFKCFVINSVFVGQFALRKSKHNTYNEKIFTKDLLKVKSKIDQTLNQSRTALNLIIQNAGG